MIKIAIDLLDHWQTLIAGLWLDDAMADRLTAMPGPGESYSDAVLRLVKQEGVCGP